MSAEKYQIVFEFSGDRPKELERITAFETRLEESLRSGEVDGHDVGGGVVNLFVVTATPEACVEEVMGSIAPAKLPLTAAAYRKQGGAEYVRVWPENDLSPFILK